MSSQEYVVRVRKEKDKQFHVMRFNAALNMDIGKFKHCKMERENFFKEVKEETEEEKPEFGAGSEYGRKEREEARRRKYEKRKNKNNNAPWILKAGGKQGKKFKGIREGGVTENTSYYVFFQAPDGAFEAFPVNEWYNFTPFQRYKALTAEEAEEKFNKRDQILNYFPLKLMNKAKGEGEADDLIKKSERSIKKEFKVSDMDDWYDSGEENLSSDDQKEVVKTKGKAKKDKKGKDKKKKKEDSDADDEPLEESDEGDYDDKEVDYMSDSSSSSESESEKGDLKAVVDESALRELALSEDDEEEEKPEENTEQTEETKPEVDKKVKVKSDKTNPNDSDISESDFDSENSDLDDSKSALLIQKSKNSQTSSQTSKQPKIKPEISDSSMEVKKTATTSNDDSSTSGNQSSNGLKFKHKLENAEIGHVKKKQKVQGDSVDGIIEDVRRYLMRKPMTCTDLLQKFKNKVNQRDNLVSIIADTLKKLEPEKQTIKGKMHFFLRPN